MKKNLIIFTFFLLISSCIVIANHSQDEKVIVIEKSPIPNEYLGEFEATHYSATGNRCSTGVYPKAGRTVAVDPKVIPYGTYLYIQNYGVRVCEDSGSAIRGNRLDIFVNSHNEAVKLGRKKVKVWVLTNTQK